MRISNIDKYLGGADNVITKEVADGNQVSFTIETNDETDFTNNDVNFKVESELFSAIVESRRGSITLSDFNANESKVSHDESTVIYNKGTGTFDFVSPENLLRMHGNVSPKANSETPYVVVVKVQWSKESTPRLRKSLRFVLIIRYQPFIVQ